MVVELAADLRSKGGLVDSKKIEVGLQSQKNSANTHFEMLFTTTTEEASHLA